MSDTELQPTSPEKEPAPVAEVELAGGTRPAPLPRRFPVMTLGLIGVLVLMAAAQFVAGGARLQWDQLGSHYGDWALGAKVPSLIAHGEYWRLVTANYLHDSPGHFFSNVIPLALFGWLVETFYGRARLFAIYTLSGVAGAVVSYKITESVSLGASTAVMGLVGAILLHNWRYRAYLSPRVNNLYPLLVLGLLIQFGWDLVTQGIDVAGHAGGLLGGAAVAALIASRVMGRDQAERDWLPLPTALATAGLLAAYGAWGLLASLPAQVPLIRAGQAGTPSEAADYLEQVVARRPYFVEARLSYGAALLGKGDVESAREAYVATTRQDPRVHGLPQARNLRTEIARIYVARGDLAYRSQNYEDTVRLLREAISLDPEPRLRAHAQNTYAWTLCDKLHRAYDEAEREVREALRVQPHEPAYIDTLAWVYYQQGRYEAALSEQRRALEVLQKMPWGNAGEYHYHLAAIYEKLGRKSEAIASYRDALRALPGCPLSTEGLRRLAPNDPLVRPAPPPPIRRMLDPAERRGLI